MKQGILKWLKNHLHRPKWLERDRQRRCWPRNTSIDRFRMCVNSILYVKSIGFSRFWPLGNRTNTQPVSISNTNADSVYNLASIEYCTAALRHCGYRFCKACFGLYWFRSVQWFVAPHLSSHLAELEVEVEWTVSPSVTLKNANAWHIQWNGSFELTQLATAVATFVHTKHI